jgi:predicted nucleic acid-binding Zn ribbon protein
MTLRSLHQVLNTIEAQEEWKARQQLQQVRTCWLEIVGQVVSQHTRPIAIYNQTLKVATSGSAWAQTLSFERHRILAKLNPRLSAPLNEIHFSTAHWQPTPVRATQPVTGDRSHPSWVEGAVERLPQPEPGDANTAFRQWAAHMQGRSKQLPLCPQCQCPTPPGELERWACCSICIAQQVNQAAIAPSPESVAQPAKNLPDHLA